MSINLNSCNVNANTNVLSIVTNNNNCSYKNLRELRNTVVRRSFGQFGPSLWVVLCLTVSHIGTTQAQINGCSKDTSIGELVSVENSVEIVSSINSQSRNFTKTVSTSTPPENRYICEGDEIIVGPNSRASLFMTEPKSVLRLDENSIFQVKSTNAPDYGRTPNQTVKPALTSLVDAIEFCHETINRTWLNLKQGALHIFTTQPQQLNINTPYMNASVEGTEFVVRVDSNQAEVSVIDGIVGVCNNEGNEVLTKGQRAAAQENAAPERVDPVNAVQWALYYPILGTNESTTQKALDAYELANKGQLADAIRTLNATTNDAYSLALRSTIAVANNQLVAAEAIANQAIAVKEDSPSAWMAKSYVEQANFDLPKAQVSVEKANELNPNDAIILARLAELKLSNDDKKGAKDVAQQAKAANPDISRTQTVLGFMQLSQFDIDDAKESFDAAIELDEADPLPRLGLGLANIRKNNIEEGKKNIEIAVSLDPGNSLLRSYLGKAYFEASSDVQAAEQLALAEELDPNDPTPNLYRAFIHQENNRPAQALKNLQASIEKNDNRAIYRSRLNLDGDNASRSALQGRIYNELKFDQRAQFLASTSINDSPQSYSAHRFLSDAYLFEPRHEIARVSELLQSQLRQPLQHSNLQAQLIDTRLGILDNTGAFESSYNENSRLFDREGWRSKIGLSVGNHSTFSDDISVSALGHAWSFSANQYFFETDGFRDNNDIEQKAYNIFAQTELSNSTGIQLETRQIDIEQGDIFQSFISNDFFENLRQNESIESSRLGFYHKIRSNFDVIGSLRYETQDTEFSINLEGLSQELISNQRGLQLELQSLYSSDNYKVIAGFGLLDSKRTDKFVFEGFEDFNDPVKPKHENLYVYTPFIINEKTSALFGVSWDDFDDGVTSEDKIKPKFGLKHDFNKNNSIRVAYFETLKRSILSDQTIEPTSIMGFNQFFDEGEGTDTEQFSIAWDGKFNAFNNSNIDIFYGAKYIKRDSDIPLFNPDFETGELIQIIGESVEKSKVLYIYSNYLLSKKDSISFGVELNDESINRLDQIALDDQIINSDTKKIIFNASYYNNKGFSINLEPTYYKQSGEFETRDAGQITGSDNFWILDINARIKLKKLHGQISFSVKNIFDKKFDFLDSDPFNSDLSKERTYLLKFIIEI